MLTNSLYAHSPKLLVHYIHKDTVLKFSNHIYWQGKEVYKTSNDTSFHNIHHSNMNDKNNICYLKLFVNSVFVHHDPKPQQHHD